MTSEWMKRSNNRTQSWQHKVYCLVLKQIPVVPSLRDEAMNLWEWQRKKNTHTHTQANLILISSTEAKRGTATRQKQRRIGFALSAFVVHVCELWLKTEDSLSTLGPFCPIVSRPLPYPPAQKIQTAAQSNAHPLYCALSHWAGPAQARTRGIMLLYLLVAAEASV